MAYDLNFNPQWSQGGGMDPYASIPGGVANGGGSTIFDYLMRQQPSAGQSIAGALPFYNLPQQQNRYFQPAYQASQAMINPDNPLYKKLYGQKRQQGQQNLAETIMELSRQNRKLTSMGRSPLLDRERGGESIFRNLIQGNQDVQNQAAGDTESLLGRGAQNLYAMGTQRSQTAQNKAGIQGNILGALTKLFGF